MWIEKKFVWFVEWLLHSVDQDQKNSKIMVVWRCAYIDIGGEDIQLQVVKGTKTLFTFVQLNYHRIHQKLSCLLVQYRERRWVLWRKMKWSVECIQTIKTDRAKKFQRNTDTTNDSGSLWGFLPPFWIDRSWWNNDLMRMKGKRKDNDKKWKIETNHQTSW